MGHRELSSNWCGIKPDAAEADNGHGVLRGRRLLQVKPGMCATVQKIGKDAGFTPGLRYVNIFSPVEMPRDDFQGESRMPAAVPGIRRRRSIGY
jgi:hypothetical protein